MKKLLLPAFVAGPAIAFSANGAEPVPFSENFENITGFRTGWQTADINNDGKTWAPSFGQATVEADYGSKIEIDDWLFTPAIQLEQGKTYVLSFECSKTYSPDGNDPSMEVKYGTVQTPEGMSQTIMPMAVQELYFDNDGRRLVLTPAATGPVYFGFHATGTQTGGIRLDNLAVKEATMPAAVTDITITKSGTYGDNKVKVSFHAPDKAVSGASLTGLQKIEVTRSGVPVKTIENPTPGEYISFDDVCAYGSGNYVWKVVPYGDDGQQGIAAESESVFVGINAPAAPANVKAVEDGNTGKITLTWDPVTTDRAGEPMPAEFIDHQVLFNGSYIVPSGATSPYTFQACEPGEQTFVNLAVAAKSTYGSGVTTADLSIAGKPYTEYHESFDNSEASHPIQQYVDVDNPASFYVYDSAMLMMALGLEGDSDGTDGCVAITSMYTNDTAGLYLGKFNVDGIDNPYLTFATHYSPITEGVNMKNIITVSADTGDGYDNFLTYNMDMHNGLEGWQRVDIPLSQFKGKDVSFRIEGKIINSPYVLIDNINLVDLKEKNLTARSITAPGTVRPDESFFVHGNIENTGTLDTPIADATLLLNGEEVATSRIEAIAPGKIATVSFSQKLTLLNEPKNVYTIRIDYADDMNEADNLSAQATVTNTLPKYPAVEDLRAEKNSSNGVSLTWSAPSGEMDPEETTESFETATDFAHSYGDWTFIDADGNPAGNYYDLPGLDDYSGPFIVNGKQYTTFAARSGNKALAFLPSEDGATDDWAISPILSGTEQEVKLYARGIDTYGFARESFHFLTSDKSAATADFTEVTTDQRLDYISGKEWTCYTFSLPEGTNYFAIRYCPEINESMGLLFDDITFTPGDSGDPLALNGYNIYRNGVKLNAEPVTGTTYDETDVPGGDHTYHVTAIYDRGESRGSNPAKVSFEVSIAKVEAAGISINGGAGEITVTTTGNAVNVAVMAADGRTVATGTAEGTLRIPAAAGIYLVATPAGAVKVAVR